LTHKGIISHCPYRVVEFAFINTFQYHQADKINFRIVFWGGRIKIHGFKLFDKYFYSSEYLLRNLIIEDSSYQLKRLN